MTVLTETIAAGDRTLVRKRVQDVEPILDQNKALQNTPQRSDWGRHVATIPNVICEKWFNEEWERGRRDLRMFSKEWDDLVALKLQDPDWKWLRVDNKSNPFFMGYGK